MNYTVGDFIIRIKNSAKANRKKVSLLYSKVNKEIGKVLIKEGFLEDIKEDVVNGKKTLSATIRYEKRIPVLKDVIIVSKPSRRIYMGVKDIEPIKRKGRYTLIVSTNKGIMTAGSAIKRKVGGEILFRIR